MALRKEPGDKREEKRAPAMTSDQVAAETQAPQSWPESGNPADETTGQSGPGPRPAATCPGPLRGARHGDLESTRISWDPVTRRPHGVRAPCTGRERGLGNGGRNGLADTPGPELTSHCPGFPLPSGVCTQKGELSPGGLDSIQGQGEAPGSRSRLPLTHWINRPTVPGKEDENHATCFVVVLPGDGERGGGGGGRGRSSRQTAEAPRPRGGRALGQHCASAASRTRRLLRREVPGPTCRRPAQPAGTS